MSMSGDENGTQGDSREARDDGAGFGAAAGDEAEAETGDGGA